MGLVALEMEIVTPNILFLKNQKDQIKRERLWKNATDRTSMTKGKLSNIMQLGKRSKRDSKKLQNTT